jgi:hypothetical protein
MFAHVKFGSALVRLVCILKLASESEAVLTNAPTASRGWNWKPVRCRNGFSVLALLMDPRSKANE